MAPGPGSTADRRGTPNNKVTTARVAEIEASGLMPLDFMLQVMRDETRPVELRLEGEARHPRAATALTARF